ncbi:MAG TPA: serine hydrolase [Thermoanaerobaculia bacterium]|nr:serine hydrolase [Thermoanaerobaculia bacterium]
MRRPSPRVALAALLLAAALSVACASAPARIAAPLSPIDAAVDAGERHCSCRIGVAARHIESGLAYDRKADLEFESASVIKIAVLTEAMAGVREGRIDLAERWTLTDSRKASESGWLRHFDAGLAPTWNDLLTLMVGPSDNTATNAWIERLGVDAVNARMRSLGFDHVRLLSLIPWLDPSADGPRWRELRFGVVTPREVAEWYARVARGELLDAESSRKIFRYLDNAPSRARIARRFSSAALWLGKTGTMSGVRNDSGILRTGKGRFVLVVFTDGSPAVGDGTPTHPAVTAIGDIARAIVDEWSRDLPDVPGQPQ